MRHKFNITQGYINYQNSLSKLFVILLISITTNCKASSRAIPLEGFNWYNEKPETQEKKVDDEESNTLVENEEELPQYEKNIRALQKKHEQAHRQALDDPTPENLLVELKLEKEMMNKSRVYAEKKVAIAMLDSQFTNMKQHNNVLHRRVQEQVDSAEMTKKLAKLSNNWGLVVQVQEECPHCHAFAPIVLEFAKTYGFELLAATNDGRDFYGIEGVLDAGKMVTFNPNRETPTLYLLKKDGSEVLPISRGINSDDQIINNIIAIDKHVRRLF